MPAIARMARSYRDAPQRDAGRVREQARSYRGAVWGKNKGRPKAPFVASSGDQRNAGTTCLMNSSSDFFFSAYGRLLSAQKLNSSTPSSW